MKYKKIFFTVALITFSLYLLFISQYTSTIKNILRGEAAGNALNLKIALQGNFSATANPRYKTKIIFYTREGKVKELTDQALTYDSQNIFKTQINLGDLKLDQSYAIFIKPDKYIGKLFCSPNSFSKDCTIPQITLVGGENTLNLTNPRLPAGDLGTQDGKVDSFDMSKIIGDIGEISQQDYLASDINEDGIVNTLDYSMALFSLSQNATDDQVNFAPLPTATPTLLPSITTIPSATNIPRPSATGTPIPTATPLPTSRPIPTATAIPTPTQPTVQGGSCNVTLNGKVYVKGLMSACSPVENEKSNYCVTTQTDCNSNKCHDIAIDAIRKGIKECGGAYGISLDEQKTQITCQVEYAPGKCTPPSTDIDCKDNGKRC